MNRQTEKKNMEKLKSQ